MGIESTNRHREAAKVEKDDIFDINLHNLNKNKSAIKLAGYKQEMFVGSRKKFEV